MGWILCKDSENKFFYYNPDSGEMTRKQPKEFIGNEEKSHLKADLGIKRLKIINKIEEMKKELADLDAQISGVTGSKFPGPGRFRVSKPRVRVLP